MKKRNKIFLSILFCFLFAMPFATSFLLQENSLETSIENIEEAMPNTKNDTDIIDDIKEQDIETTWETPTYKTYDDYFTDYDITAETITEGDLTGTGTASNPYVVHSTRGFLWLTNNTLSKISLSNKVIELASDIVLNEEIFDENGKYSGGDGVVYQWQPTAKSLSFSLYGNKHNIKGLYISGSTSSHCTLFGNVSAIKHIQDFKMSNIYIQTEGSNSYALADTISYAENCILASGTIIGKQQISAFADVSKNFVNCENYVDVIAKGNFASGFSRSGVKHTNCANYGNIQGAANVGGFISTRWTVNATFIDCANYGDISSTNMAAGFVSEHLDGKCVFKNCANYGDVSATMTTSARFAGGFVGSGANDYFYNCVNYGYIVIGSKCANFQGQGKSQIVDCKYFLKFEEERKQNISLIGVATSTSYISNCYLEIQNYQFYNLNTYSREVLLLRSGNVEAKNIEVLLFSDKESNSVRLGGDSILKNTIVKNVNIRTNFEVDSKSLMVNSVDCQMNGIIVSTNKECRYYGSDFSGFYCDWKTGTIGLKALSGKGFYQSEVTEQTLIDKGYIKKEI